MPKEVLSDNEIEELLDKIQSSPGSQEKDPNCIFSESLLQQVKKFFHLLAIKLRNRLLIIRAVHAFFLLLPVKILILKNTGVPLRLLLLMHFIHGILIRFLLILITLFVRLFCFQIFLML